MYDIALYLAILSESTIIFNHSNNKFISDLSIWQFSSKSIFKNSFILSTKYTNLQ